MSCHPYPLSNLKLVIHMMVELFGMQKHLLCLLETLLPVVEGMLSGKWGQPSAGFLHSGDTIEAQRMLSQVFYDSFLLVPHVQR